MSGSWGDLLNPTSIFGVFAISVVFIILWRKDASNPAITASHSVITSSVEYSSSVFKVAQEAMDMAQEAMESQRRCERRNIAFVAYTRKLQAQVVAAGGVPADPPPGMLE